MNKQDVAQRVFHRTGSHSVHIDKIVELVNQIEEPQKVAVPKFVAEWIEEHKGDYNKWDEEAKADFVFRSINDLFRFGDGLSPWDFTIDEKFSEWTTKNAYKFITAILFGYTVEKEKLYTVRIPNPNRTSFPYALYRKNDGKIIIIGASDNFEEKEEYQLTGSEIKQDFNFLWQFAKSVEVER